MKQCSDLFLWDAWEPKTLKNFKNTIVFTDKWLFEQFVDLLRDAKFKTAFSAMHVDLEKKCVEIEKTL